MTEHLEIVALDDQHEYTDLYEAVLSDHTVSSYNIPSDFLEDIDHLNPDLYILDYQMPEKTGVEVAEIILDKKEDPNIVFNSCTDPETIRREMTPEVENQIYAIHSKIEADITEYEEMLEPATN